MVVVEAVKVIVVVVEVVVCVVVEVVVCVRKGTLHLNYQKRN